MSSSIEGHTVHRYDGELSHLHMLLLEMGGLVADQIRLAVEAVGNRDTDAARRVLEREREVDSLEVKADEEIVSVIARRAPVARDLRVIVSISKAVADLERVGDEATRIAGMALKLYEPGGEDPARHPHFGRRASDRHLQDTGEHFGPSAALLRDIHTMGRLAVRMLDEALQAFDALSAEQAEQLIRGHGELEAEFQSSVRRLATFILEDPRTLGHAINIVLVVKALEHIGDHARNLAEYVIYLVRGKDVRDQSVE